MHKDKQRIRYEQLKQAGLCVQCARKADANGSLCNECKQKRRIQQNQRKSANLCVRCGKRPAAPNKTNCAECVQYRHDYRASHPEHRRRALDYNRKWTASHKTRVREREKKYRAELRQSIFDHYGHQCACCGESIPEFLTLDHMHGGGYKHRRELMGRQMAGWRFYRKIKQLGYPQGLQILCWNCNSAKAYYGECPHQRQR